MAKQTHTQANKEAERQTGTGKDQSVRGTKNAEKPITRAAEHKKLLHLWAITEATNNTQNKQTSKCVPKWPSAGQVEHQSGGVAEDRSG